MHKIQSIFQQSVSKKGVILFTVFLLAFLPRLFALDSFLAADENDQLEFAADFLDATLQQDWEGMLVLGYPGVPTMAMGALGIWGYQELGNLINRQVISVESVSPIVASVSETSFSYHNYLPLIAKNISNTTEPLSDIVLRSPLEFIQAMRLPIAVVTSLSIVLAFIALSYLLGQQIAFFATILLAFEPYFMANSIVVHVDAPLTYFMLVSFLGFLVFIKNGQWRWLIISSIFGGLAMLSKTPGVLLLPILTIGGGGFAFLDSANRVRLVKRWAQAMGIWVIIVGVTFVAVWPAMWTRPIFALNWITDNVIGALNNPHPYSGIFWRDFKSDQSMWYYLVAFPFKIAPLTFIGLFISVGMSVRGIAQKHRINAKMNQNSPLLFALWVFVIFFWGALVPVERRTIRYLLPIFPIINIIATLGLFTLVMSLFKKRGIQVLSILVAIQVLYTISFHPYYFSYFNPLMGGANSASQYILVGRGEGLKQAAEYLNQKPTRKNLNVTSWYSWQFAPYFEGNTVRLSTNEVALISDYTLFYINQIQRGFPSEELLNYYSDREPEKIISLKGMDYVWIYPGPIIGKTLPENVSNPLNLSLNEAITLQGIEHTCDGITTTTCPITLYWQATDSLPADLNASIRVVDNTGLVWGQVDRLPIGGVIRTDKWEPNSVIRDEYKLHLDPAMPAGDYTFDILLYDFKSGDVFAKASHVGQLSVGELSAGDDTFYDYQPHGYFEAVELANGLTLENHTFKNTETLPGYPRYFKSYWRADEDTSVQFIARHGDTELMLGENEILASDTMRGQTDRIVFPAAATAGEYEIFAQAKGGEARLGTVTLLAQSHSFDMPIGIERTDASFGDAIDLAGYELSAAGDAIDLKLYWQPKDTPQDNLKVFVHITDAGGNIIAQRDAIPASGARPTQTWVSGEVIADEYHIPIEGKADGVWVGMYNPLTGERVAVSSNTLSVSDNRLRIK